MKYFLANIFLLLGHCLAQAATINVTPNAAGTSLKQAVAKAQPNDVLLVQAGVYYAKELILDKKLHLKGVGWPVIDGQSKGDIIVIKAEGCIVEGFTIKNSGYSGYNDVTALRILNTRHATVRNNKFLNNFFAVYSQNSSKSIIQNNVIKSNVFASQQLFGQYL